MPRSAIGRPWHPAQCHNRDLFSAACCRSALSVQGHDRRTRWIVVAGRSTLTFWSTEERTRGDVSSGHDLPAWATYGHCRRLVPSLHSDRTSAMSVPTDALDLNLIAAQAVAPRRGSAVRSFGL